MQQILNMGGSISVHSADYTFTASAKMPLGGYLASAVISIFDIWDLSFKDSPDVDDSVALTMPFLRVDIQMFELVPVAQLFET